MRKPGISMCFCYLIMYVTCQAEESNKINHIKPLNRNLFCSCEFESSINAISWHSTEKNKRSRMKRISISADPRSVRKISDVELVFFVESISKAEVRTQISGLLEFRHYSKKSAAELMMIVICSAPITSALEYRFLCSWRMKKIDTDRIWI